MDVPSFLKRRPEFRETNPDLVSAALVEAANWVHPSAWGAKTDDGVMYYAADVLTTNPMGGTTLMDVSDGKASVYKRKFDELAAIVACGSFLVA